MFRKEMHRLAMISGKPKAIECDQQAPDGIFPKFRRAAMRIHAARLHACSVCRYLFRQRSLHAKRQLRRGEFGHHIGSNARGKRSDAPVAGRAEPA